MKIKNKLILISVMLVSVTSFVLALVSINQVKNQTLSSFKEQSEDRSKLIDAYVVSLFSSIKEQTEALAKSPLTAKAIEQGLSKYLDANPKLPSETALTRGGAEAELFKHIKSIGESSSLLQYVYLGDSDGGYAEWPGTNEYSNWDMRTGGDWFPSARTSGDGKGSKIMGSYYWEPDNTVYVPTVHKITNASGDFVGVAAMDISLQNLTEQVKNLDNSDTGGIIIFEDNGNLLVDSFNTKNSFIEASKVPEAYKQLLNANDTILPFTLDGIDYIASLAKSNEMGWTYVSVILSSDITAGVTSVTSKISIGVVILIIIATFLSIFIANKIVQPINQVLESLKSLAQGDADLSVRLNDSASDETGELAKWFNQFLGSIAEMVSQIKANAIEVAQTSEQTTDEATKMRDESVGQLELLEQVVTATTEMSASAKEIAETSARSADAAQESGKATQAGAKLIEQSTKSVHLLAESIQAARDVIIELQNETSNIDQILVTIRGIAEQTNLLALNAAIEAARAGEQGRGFAVVADEVRELAKRAQNSTDEISTILNTLVEKSKVGVDTINVAGDESQKTLSYAEEVMQSFSDIDHSIHDIGDHSIQTASATEEQSLVSNDITKNITGVSDASKGVSMMSTQVQELCRQQKEVSDRLNELVSRFKL
ncbi:MAG: methyl-accepting chemotaxis protein [Gammaproteobacteria bacterium]|nr:methyl-accepting chemotaxis protein [Gammaproteobacteria bacterium]